MKNSEYNTGIKHGMLIGFAAGMVIVVLFIHSIQNSAIKHGVGRYNTNDFFEWITNNPTLDNK